MYLWKYWRDNRARLIACLIVIPAIVALMIMVMERTLPAPELSNRARDFSILWTTTLMGSRVLVLFLALALGASGIGEEFAQRTAEFLLTRPRSRRYFVWAGWAAGAGQFMIIASVFLLVTFVALLYRFKIPFAWDFLSPIVPLFIWGAVVYGLTYLITTMLRNTRNGFATGLGMVLFYPALVSLLQYLWSIQLPSPGDLFTPMSFVAEGTKAAESGVSFPVVAAVGWTLVALACPLVAQLIVERLEV